MLSFLHDTMSVVITSNSVAVCDAIDFFVFMACEVLFENPHVKRLLYAAIVRRSRGFKLTLQMPTNSR